MHPKIKLKHVTYEHTYLLTKSTYSKIYKTYNHSYWNTKRRYFYSVTGFPPPP